MTLSYAMKPGSAARTVMAPALIAYQKLRLCSTSVARPTWDNALSHLLSKGVNSGLRFLTSPSSSSSSPSNASAIKLSYMTKSKGDVLTLILLGLSLVPGLLVLSRSTEMCPDRLRFRIPEATARASGVQTVQYGHQNHK